MCEKKIPFVCFVDFLKINCEVYSLDELSEAEVFVSFPKFRNEKSLSAQPADFSLDAFPKSEEEYAKGFHSVQNHLKKGNSYLVNYTCKTEIQTNFSLEQIFDYSKAKYKILYQDNLVCFSPETFIEIKNGKISTHPMKGTIDAQIPNAARLLKDNAKEKAEHYTVVDLLRNDLSMVAEGVCVDEFQRIDFIETAQKNLYAMSSEISGTLKPHFTQKIGSILEKLLPAGSILGAPKRRTQEIILEAETYDRGFYTGICGYFDGEDFDSCVMIRFIEKQCGKYYFKSGGGITHLSSLRDEYHEMKNKIYVPVY